IAELIRAEPREVADRGTSPGGRYGAVRRVAAMAKEIVALVVDLVELHQGFAHADDVRRLLRHFRSVRTLRDLPSAIEGHIGREEGSYWKISPEEKPGVLRTS